MKLVDIKKIPTQEQGRLKLIAGIRQGQLVLVAKREGGRGWTLYQNAGQGSPTQQSLIRLESLSSLDDVLASIQSKGLRPFCPRPEKSSEEGAPEAEGPVRSMVERRYYRKQVNLNGEYLNRRTGSFGSALIADVSFKGLKFTTLGSHDIQVGDRLQVSFTLDNTKQSLIKRKVLAKHVQAQDIGAEFVNPPEYDKELGFYLI
jgi:hypothetical protein